MRNAIVLAAGKGTRMRSVKNKVMHPILDRPVLGWVVDACKKAGAQRIVVITGYEAESIEKAFPDLEFALQSPQLGTGHAVMQARQLENEQGQTLIINGDGPCIQPETIEKLYEAAKDASLTLLSTVVPEAKSYGRIIRDPQTDELLSITEAKDCTPEQLEINEINVGCYCFDNQDLFEGLKHLTTNNAQHEYYLTDLVQILRDQNKKVQAVIADDWQEVQGVNDPVELAEAAMWIQDKINKDWMKQGVQIMDPARTMIGPDVQIGHDVLIWPNTEILGNSVIEDYAEILPGSHVNNCHVGQNAKVQMSVLENTDVPADALECGTVRKGS